MRGLQGTFPQCKKCLPSKSDKQWLVLEAIVLVNNFCTDYVGMNQIKTVFNSLYVCMENLEDYDWIAQYYFKPGDYNIDDNEEDGSDNDNSIN